MSKTVIAKISFNLQWLVIVFILFISTFTFGGTSVHSIYWTRLFIAFSLILQALLFLSEDHYFSDFQPVICLPLFFYAAFLALVYVQASFGLRLFRDSRIGSINSYVTYNSFIQLVIYLLFFLICVKTVAKREAAVRISSWVVIFALGITAWGLIQNVMVDRAVIKELILTARSLWFGPFVNQNNLGGFLGLSFPLFLGLMQYRWHRFKRKSAGDLQEKAVWVKWAAFVNTGTGFLLLLAILALVACFFTGARMSAFVLLFCCIVYFSVSSFRKRNIKIYLLLLAILLSSFLFIRWLGYDKTAAQFSAKQLQSTFDVRMAIAKESLQIFYRFPLFGTGLDTYRFIAGKVTAPGIWDYSVVPHVYNDYVELLTEAGIAGFFLFFAAIFSLLLIALFQRAKNPSSWSRTITYQAIISMLGIGIMEYADYHLKFPAVAFMFTLQLAFLFQLSRFKEAHSVQPEACGRMKFGKAVLRLIFPLICFALSLSLVFSATRIYHAQRLSYAGGNHLLNLKNAVTLQPSNADFWHQLGAEYDLKARRSQEEEKKAFQKEAIVCLQKAAALNPTFAYYWFYLGTLEYSAGFTQEGIVSLKRSLVWAPNRQVRYSLYLLSVYLREAKRNGPTPEGIKYFVKAKNLYQSLQRFEPPPKKRDYEHWMAKYYYDQLQRAIPYWENSPSTKQ
ncbi:MAG: hypothetical protein A3C35_08425 [Omnitrophica bacterium RIFCSPHIGHO2_02_FULL_46_11]|nr:MAG: hypothetical protein A3C35_08425 [Omnitrophica bacterium RIFCSPHIGHO2_02_FULL_46_11]OGW87823.1 MAG: hypothetical protein A3A81_01900 [Omnitrophica bacterium RIFCSPLOWO2_01_FULL_45_10b]